MVTTLKRSKDRKVTNGVTKSGAAAIANSIGLPSGIDFSCVSQTDYCKVICYAGKLEKVYKGVSAVLLHNWEALRNASYGDTVTMLTSMMNDFVAESQKRNAPLKFRIHWDGDFFSGAYVAAWSKVIAEFPSVQFWVYTRVATAAKFLHDKRHQNLGLYFSADRDNVEVARSLAAMGVNVAYVGDTFADGKDVFPTATRCPENNGAIPLITPEGSACIRCGLCVSGRKSVVFSASKK